LFSSLVDANPAQRIQRRSSLLVEKNKEQMLAAEKIIMAPSSSSKDLNALGKELIVTFLVSQRGPLDRERLDGMTKPALVDEIKEWVSPVSV
jgi:hypothetical protein